ncbi:hypothetical protein ACTI_43470 [Actinoplanes sp. OR16]|uniref:hypothetical protein n=1 Tax=Actinoplanes sp. OR16 TaxID=946334 RepID=UPI000F6F05D2|nr:hypothetical protein [Actinoplanes sp. OR16]BBH67662.1 hypothetical protein ACTI_43470 [Actinoplanes sp. OR16]
MPRKTRTRADEVRKQILVATAAVTGVAAGFGGLGAFAVDRYTTDRTCTAMVELGATDGTPQSQRRADAPTADEAARQLSAIRDELSRTESRLLFNQDLRTAVRGFSADTERMERLLTDLSRFTTIPDTTRTTAEHAEAQVALVKDSITVLRTMDQHTRDAQVACGLLPVGIPAIQEQLDTLSA